VPLFVGQTLPVSGALKRFRHIHVRR